MALNEAGVVRSMKRIAPVGGINPQAGGQPVRPAIL